MVPYLALVTPDAPQRRHDLREVFNALRWIVRAGSPWRLLPTNFPPWAAVYQQTRRWLAAGVFEAMAHDLRMLLREAAARMPQPRAVILDSRTVQSTPESGAGAGYDGHKTAQGAQDARRRSTPWGICWPSSSPRPTPRTGPRSRRWRQQCRTSPGRAWSWRTSTRATPESRPRPMRRGTKSSSTRSRSPSDPRSQPWQTL